MASQSAAAKVQDDLLLFGEKKEIGMAPVQEEGN
jgi:hypothetical protein